MVNTVLLLVTWMAAQNIDPPGTAPFVILSEGATTCGEYVAQPLSRDFRAQWVLGYISGLNAGATGTRRMAGRSFQMPATVGGWLQSYCAAHPLDVLTKAGEQLRLDFLKHENP